MGSAFVPADRSVVNWLLQLDAAGDSMLQVGDIVDYAELVLQKPLKHSMAEFGHSSAWAYRLWQAQEAEQKTAFTP